MPDKFPPCEVRTNRLSARHHSDNEVILFAVTAEREIQIRVEQGRYWVYCFIVNSKCRWTRLAAGRDTLQEARELALEMVRETL